VFVFFTYGDLFLFVEPNTTGENSESVSPAFNLPKIVSASEVTELVSGLLTNERLRLVREMAEAEDNFREAQENLRLFQDALRNDSAEHPAFGQQTSYWSDTRHFPNGDSVCVERGEDDCTPSDSICGFVRKVESKVEGFLFAVAVQHHKDTWDEMIAAGRDCD
jgi:hypothetical protein